MIPTVPLDIPNALFFGALIGLFGKRVAKADRPGPLSGPAAWGALVGLLYGVSVTYFYFVYTDWMLSYFMDARSIPVVPVWAVFVATLTAAGWLGALAVQSLFIAGRDLWAWVFSAYAALAFGMVWLVTLDRYMHVGSYDEYMKGIAVRLPDHAAIQRAMAVAGPATAVIVAVPALLLFFRGRKASPAT